MKNLKRLTVRSAGVGLSALAIGLATPAAAEGAAADADQQAAAGTTGSESAQGRSNEIDEIVVTATLRRTLLQETPVAITAFSEEQLQNNVINSIDDAAILAPNVTTAGRRNALSAPFIIRGIGANVVGFGLDDPVAQYVDDVYLGRPAAGAFNFADIERVEILRGPQGTLRGRNSTGGAISVVSRRPEFDDISGQADVEYGRFSRLRSRASVNVPITDKIAARVGGYYGDDNGRSINTFLDRRTDTDKGYAVRGSLLFQLSDDTDLLVIGDWSRFKQQFGFDAIPFASFQENSDEGNPFSDDRYSNNVYSNSRVRSRGVNVTLDHQFNDSLSLKSITAYRKYDSRGIVDADGSTPDVIARLPASQRANNLDQTTIEDQKQFSQELRLNYEGDGPVSVIGGLFFFRENVDAQQDLGIRGVLPSFLVGVIPGLRFPDIFRHFTGEYKNEAWAAFAQISYDLTDKLTAEVGARVSLEDRESDARQVVPPGFFSTNAVTGQTLFEQNVRKSYQDVSPSFGLNYQATEDTFLYGRVSRGFKSGGFNQTFAQDPFDPERLWAYEGGVKTDLFDRVLRFNTAVFYYDYSNLQTQVPGPVPNTNIIENAGSSETYGVEVETTFRPVDRLQFDGTLGYLHAEFKNYRSSAGDLSGNRLNGAPRWQWTVSGQYEIPIGEWATLTPRVQAKHEGYTFFTPENDARFAHKPFTLLNAYLTLADIDDVWFGRLFLENITGVRYRTTAQQRDPLTCFCRSNPPFAWYLQAGVRF